MEINLNNNGIGNLGMGQGITDMQGVDAGLAAKNAQKAGAAAPLTITEAMASPEDVEAAAIPESALSRDDDLGKLMDKAFNLPPPPMPTFL
jgi:hypothetical protein